MRSKIVALMGFLSLAAAACSLIVERGADQCSTDADCRSRGPAFQDAVCSADRTCVSGTTLFDAGEDTSTSETEPVRECETNAECITKLAGAPAICRKDTHVCVAVLDEECETVRSTTATGTTLEGADAVRDDDTILIGALISSKAPGAGGQRSISRLHAVELAVSEVMATAGGLPAVAGKTKRRPVAVVGCNDHELQSPPPPEPAPVRAGNHLYELGVAGVVGANTSGNTIQVIPILPKRGVFLISPSATTPILTSADDDGLFWRTAPSDALQAIPLASLIMDRAPDNGTQRVFVLYRNDAYGVGLFEKTVPLLTRNGLPITDVSNTSIFRARLHAQESSADLSSLVTEAHAFRPNVIAILGTTDTIDKFVTPLETGWNLATSNAPRPVYVGSDSFKAGAGVPTAVGRDEAADSGVGSSPPLRERFVGTAPGRPTATTDAFKIRFEPRYGSENSGAFGTAGAYDAAYVIMYGIAASSSEVVTGRSIADGVRKLVGGATKIDVGPSGINDAFQRLSAGQTIDLNGASSPLDFDEAGESPADIEVWCVSQTPPAINLLTTPRFYNAATQQMSGVFSCP